MLLLRQRKTGRKTITHILNRLNSIKLVHNITPTVDQAKQYISQLSDDDKLELIKYIAKQLN